MSALAIMPLPEPAPSLRVKNPYATSSRLSDRQRVRAMMRCRLFSRETWRQAVKQFLSDPRTAEIARAELAVMGIHL